MTTLLTEFVRLTTPVCFFLLFALGASSRPAADGPVLVLANPFGGKTALELIAESNGRILAAGASEWLAVGTDGGDGLFRAALKARAVALLKPFGRPGCLATADRSRRP